MNKLSQRQAQVLWGVFMAGSISGAARMLNVSQPAVSRMLTQTEKQLGFLLFRRVRGRLQSSPEMRALFVEIDEAHRTLERVNDLAEALSAQRAGVLRIASMPSLGQFVVPAAIARFRALNPGIMTRYHSVPIQQLVPAVLDGEVELGLSVLPAEDPFLSSVPLGSGRMVAALPAHHPLAAKRIVTLQDLTEIPHIIVGTRMHFGSLVLAAFAREEIACPIAVEVGVATQACALVNAGVGAAIVDEFSVMENIWPQVVVRPLATEIPLSVSAIYANSRPLSRVAKAFLKVLCAMSVARSFALDPAPRHTPSRGRGPTREVNAGAAISR